MFLFENFILQRNFIHSDFMFEKSCRLKKDKKLVADLNCNTHLLSREFVGKILLESLKSGLHKSCADWLNSLAHLHAKLIGLLLERISSVVLNPVLENVQNLSAHLAVVEVFSSLAALCRVEEHDQVHARNDLHALLRVVLHRNDFAEPDQSAPESVDGHPALLGEVDGVDVDELGDLLEGDGGVVRVVAEVDSLANLLGADLVGDPSDDGGDTDFDDTVASGLEVIGEVVAEPV